MILRLGIGSEQGLAVLLEGGNTLFGVLLQQFIER